MPHVIIIMIGKPVDHIPHKIFRFTGAYPSASEATLMNMHEFITWID